MSNQKPDGKVIPLNIANIKKFSSQVQIPKYERKNYKNCIVHIGVGGFHRAHQAVYLDDLLHIPEYADWSICGVGLLPHDKRIYDTMKKQDCLYTVVERRKPVTSRGS
jgi:mannitol 2-dehydrogenase